MPYPYRQSRCWCKREGVFSYDGEYYCSEHIPYRDMASNATIEVATIIGYDAKNKMIDKWFPTDESFSWQELYEKSSYLLAWLTVPTGLLVLDS